MAFCIYRWNSIDSFNSYSGGYCAGAEFGNLIRNSIIRLCDDLKNDAVALVDAIAPPDFVLNSAIGRADGEVMRISRIVY